MDQTRPGMSMAKPLTLAVSGTPGTGKSSLCEAMKERGWTVSSVRELAKQHRCLGEVDETDGANTVDIHRLAEAWSAPTEGLHLIAGHLAHLLDVDGIVLLRCHPSPLRQRLELRGYPAIKVQNNVEWEMLAGHWSEILEFEIQTPLIELDSSALETGALVERVVDWVASQLASQPAAGQAPGAIDWLVESLE